MISLVVAKLLTDGIASDYLGINPKLDPEDRFAVYPAHCNLNSEEYVIRRDCRGLSNPHGSGTRVGTGTGTGINSPTRHV